MDRKLHADDQWYVSPLLELKQVKEDLLEAKQSGEDTVDREIADPEGKHEKEQEMEALLQSMMVVPGITMEEAAEAVEEVTNLDMFLGPSDLHVRKLDDMKGDKDFLKKSKLHTHEHVAKREEQMKTSRQRKSAYVTALKYDKYLMNGGMNTAFYRPQCSLTNTCDDDIVITVDVICPYNRQLESNELRSSRLLKPQTKLLLRGDTLLYDLRQKLHCISDTIFPLGNGHELEAADLGQTTASKFPSSFIFVHDTFYVDSGHPSATDISFPIRQFMQHKDIYDPVEARLMENVKVVDLSLRLGQPYVFQHQGNCEHLLIFHDLRLLHETDPRGIEKFPFILFEKGSERKCEICRRGHVEFVVERHELLPNTYTYFCRPCFQEFNFVHGMKSHSFNAWPYTEAQKVENQNGWPFDMQDDDDD